MMEKLTKIFVIILMIIYSFIIINTNIYAQSFRMKCIRVIDADTLLFKYYGLPVKIRLKEADAYETYHNKHLIKQMNYLKLTDKEIIKRGKIAKKLVKNIMTNKICCVIINTKKPFGYYGRYIAKVYINRRCDGQTLSDLLIQSHLAIRYKDLVEYENKINRTNFKDNCSINDINII